MNALQVLTLTDDKLDEVVKIQGTQWDRKRKVTPDLAKQMSKMIKKGKKVSEIAEKFNLSDCAVRYNTDPIWRANFIASKSGKHTGKDHITVKNRVAYKRSLVAQGKLTAMA